MMENNIMELKKVEDINVDLPDTNNTELTDEDIESIAETINSVDSLSEAMLNSAKVETNKPQHNEESVANVVINPANGKPMAVEELENDDFYLQSFEEMLADPTIVAEDVDLNTIEYKKEDIDGTLSNYGVDCSKLTDEDYNKIRECIIKFNNKEKYSFYSHFPEEVKKTVLDAVKTVMEEVYAGSDTAE